MSSLLHAAQTKKFRHGLLTWFDAHARDLPWRRTSDPYAIWVSEIMLQQTRVNAVLDHYARFMDRFPTVQSLAQANEPEVLAIWSGLGYYRRARMLHKGAKFVVEELAGKIPETADGLRQLAGIGEYTSAAIASIAFGESAAVVDGNVERVVMRLAALERTTNGKASALDRTIRETAQALLDHNRPGDANQAMMELGATVCLPKNPLCLQCPVEKLCRTRGEHPTAPRKESVSGQASYALLRRVKRDQVEVLLEHRPHDASLMGGMWELPQLDAAEIASDQLLLSVRHSITTTNYQVRILAFEPQEERTLPKRKTRKWVGTDALPNLPLTGLARKVLKRLQLLPGSSVRTIPPLPKPQRSRDRFP